MIKFENVKWLWQNFWVLLVWCGPYSMACGHGLPIFVSVNATTNQVEVSGTFDDAVVDGFFLSDVPGFGVLNQFSGIAAGKTIRLRMPQPLLFSNSEVLESTSSTVTVYSAEFAQTVEVNQTSGFQESLDWAVYPAGAEIGWDADGLFELSPGSPAIGVYGVVVQVQIDGALDSEPFVIPVVHNPTDLAASKAALQTGILPLPTADFTRDWRVNDADLHQWETHHGLSQSPGTAKVFGDADDDGDVDGRDFLFWQRGFGTSPTGEVAATATPEPAGFVLLGFGGIVLGVWGARDASRC